MSAPSRYFDRRNVAIVVLLALVATAAAVWWREANRRSAQQGETVEVVIASRDLTTGMCIRHENVHQLTEVVRMPRSQAPTDGKVVTTQNELIGKRLGKATPKGAWFTLGDLASYPPLTLAAGGADVLTLPMPWRGDVAANDRVDILATRSDARHHETFTLLVDVHVVAVKTPPEAPKHGLPSVAMVSFAVDQKQALLLLRARQSDCQLELLLRHPDSPKREYDFNRVLHRVVFGMRPDICNVDVPKRGSQESGDRLDAELEIAPAPRVKP